MIELIKKLELEGIIVVVTDIDRRGYAVAGIKTIFVDSKLTEEKQIEVTYHELKHILDHAEYIALYDKFVYHSKMENDAEKFMINSLISENEGLYNYTGIVENFKIGLGYDTRFEFLPK